MARTSLSAPVKQAQKGRPSSSSPAALWNGEGETFPEEWEFWSMPTHSCGPVLRPQTSASQPPQSSPIEPTRSSSPPPPLGDRHEGTPRQAARGRALERDFINSVQEPR